MDVLMPESRESVTIKLNGREVEAFKGEMLIAAAERAGEYIPRFCYHPRMESVGVCRMCLVEVDGPRGATLQPSCYISVQPDMVVTTDSDKVKKAQDGVLEFLLANHPLDCPVCDKGGECPLQDQTLAHGSGETRFIEEKRHFAKPISIGELVLLDRERCIQCSRCTRFAADVAGDAQITFSGRGDSIEVAPFPTEPFDSVFSGNTVQICPVGALTAKPYRFTARPWDLEQVESTCTSCAMGCRVAVQSSGDRITRLLGVDSDAVNHGWMCDKGRFSFEAAQSDEGTGDVLDPRTRLTTPLIRRNGTLTPANWGEALSAAATILRESGAAKSGVVGGARLTNESLFAWQRFARDVIGTDSIDASFGDAGDAATWSLVPRASINDAAEACTVVVIGADIAAVAPVLHLRLRQSVTAGRTNVVALTTGASSQSSIARVRLAVRPGETHLVAAAVTGDHSALAQLELHPQGTAFSRDELAEAQRLIGSNGEGVVVVVGRANYAESADVTDAAIRSLAAALPGARFLPTWRRANLGGAFDLGFGPGLAPGRRVATTRGRRVDEQIAAMASGEQSALLLLGSLLDNVVNRPQAINALERASVIVVAGNGGDDLAYADVVLPVAIDHERTGTVTNFEGRVTAVAAKVTAPSGTWSDIAVASELAEEFGQNLGLTDATDTARVIEELLGYPTASVLRDGHGDGVITGVTGDQSARLALDPVAFPGVRSADAVGLLARAGDVAVDAVTSATWSPSTWSDLPQSPAPQNPAADAYSLRVVVAPYLYDGGVAVSATSAFNPLVAASVATVNPYDANRLGINEGDIVRFPGEGGVVRLPVSIDDATTKGTVVVPFHAEGVDGDDVLATWGVGASLVTEVRMESR